MKAFYALALCALCGMFAVAHAEVSLKGSHESQEKQNAEADQAGLVRIKNDATLVSLKRSEELVRIPDTRGVAVDYRLNEKWAWIRPWTAEFLVDLGRDFEATFQRRFYVGSAVRTVWYQRLLQRINKNAAATHGNRSSSHPTGATIDITKLPLTSEELEWLRARLLALEAQGLIEATEEWFQLVFHIMVFPRYSTVRLAGREKEETEGR